MLYNLEPESGESLEAFIDRFKSVYKDAALPDEHMTAIAYATFGKQYLSFKSASSTVKNLTSKVLSDNSTMSGYSSVFEVKDLVGDIILPGAFSKTLGERVKSGKVPFMLKHIAEGGTVCDTIGSMSDKSFEDDIGLFSVFNLFSVDKAVKAKKLAQDALDNYTPIGLSVEFVPIQFEPNEFGGLTYKEVKLIQVTLTPTPCNELACVTSIKGARPATAKRWRDRLNLMFS
jgi:HK97 family phage prohead protease